MATQLQTRLRKGSKSTDVIEIPAGSRTIVETTIAEDRTLFAISHCYIGNTSDGANMSWCNVYNIDVDYDTGTIEVSVRNYGTNDAKVRVTIYYLYY